MQLMPATAQWVAKKLKLKDWRWAHVTDVDTNVSLGTWYLRHVLDSLDGQPVLASAAYNAGPGRARAWRPGVADRGRGLRRDHTLQRDAGLREKGDGERHLLRARARPADAAPEAAPEHDRAAPARPGAVAGGHAVGLRATMGTSSAPRRARSRSRIPPSMTITTVAVLGGSGFAFGRARPGACLRKRDEAARLTFASSC